MSLDQEFKVAYEPSPCATTMLSDQKRSGSELALVAAVSRILVSGKLRLPSEGRLNQRLVDFRPKTFAEMMDESWGRRRVNEA